MNHLIDPHGGELCELMVSEPRRKQLQEASLQYSSLTLNDRQLCDIEMLLNGGFSPLKGFLGQADYKLVLADNRLSDGTVWPIPITLDVSEKFGEKLKVGDKIVLRDHEGIALGILNISDKWIPNLEEEAKKVYVFCVSFFGGSFYWSGLGYPRHFWKNINGFRHYRNFKRIFYTQGQGR